MDIFKQMEEVVGQEEPKEFDLGPISKLGDRQAALEAKEQSSRVDLINAYCESIGASIADIEGVVKRYKKELFNISQVQIPELMTEYGLATITTSSGVGLEIKDGISVTAKDKDKLHAFIRSTDSGDLIKSQVIIETQDEQQRKEVLELLNKTQFVYESTEAIHAQTLKKFIRGQLKEGKNVPADAVKVFEYKFTKLKR